LAEYPSSEVREAVEPFLGDVNESVRFHASGTLFSLGDAESAEPLIAALSEEESLRVKNRIARGLEQAGWVLSDELAKRAETALPPGYGVRDARVVTQCARAGEAQPRRRARRPGGSHPGTGA